MKKIVILVFLISGILLTGCEKNNLDHNSIIGQWKWFKDYPMIPEKVYSTYFIEFNKNGYYNVFDSLKNLTVSRQYELKTGKYPNYFKFGDDPWDFGYKINNDTLSTWNRLGFMIYTSYYTRIY